MQREGTVFVIDDDPDVRRSMVRLLEEVGHEVKAFGSADEFERGYAPGDPGCVVLDLRMPGKSGVALHEDLVARGSDLPVIIVTAHADVETAVAFMQRGALDVLEKPFKAQALIDRVHQALERNAREREAKAERDAIESRFAQLTDREHEVVELVAEGLNNKQIAAQLGVTPQAIDARRAKAMRKLGVDNVAALVRLAQTRELLRRSEDGEPKPPRDGPPAQP